MTFTDPNQKPPNPFGGWAAIKEHKVHLCSLIAEAKIKRQGGNALNTQKNTEKLTDKAFSRLWITSIVGILICIACLCSTTWAWFSADQSAEGNTVQSGNFNLDISVTKEQSSSTVESREQTLGDIEITELSNGKLSCTLEKGQYTVVLKTTPDTTVSRGFCKMMVGETAYYTDSISTDATDSFTFTLDVIEDGTTVLFSPAWGVPAEVDVEWNKTLQIGTATTVAQQETEQQE